MKKPSREFRTRYKISDVPGYRLAQQAGLSPSQLSKFVCGIEPMKDGDPRIIRVAELLGLRPDEAFETAEQSQ